MNLDATPHWLPRALLPFFSLSYPVGAPLHPDAFPDSNYYLTGRLDVCFVVAWVLILGMLRAALRLGVLEPYARSRLTKMDMKLSSSTNGHTNGIANGHTPKSIRSPGSDRQPSNKAFRNRERGVRRFAEQGWQLTYSSVYWLIGLIIHLALPSAPFKLEKLWEGYPHFPLAAPVKFYYLTQLAFWIHQVLVLNAEEWRKDHVQMMSHHIITISLITASYYYNFTRVGVLIMVLMDLCDIFLALAKSLRYIRAPNISSDVVFAFFAISWFVTRHALFGMVIWSAYHEAPLLLPFTWAPEKGYYLTREWYAFFVALLVALEATFCLWSVTLVKLIWKVLNGSPVDDSRSDDDTDDEDVEHEKKNR